MIRCSCRVLAALFVLTCAAAPALAQFPEIQVINDSEDPALSSVDIYLDGLIYFEDIGYRLSTGLLQISSVDQVEVGVAPGNSTSSADIIASQIVDLPSGTQTVLVVEGLAASLAILHQRLDPAPSMPQLRVTIFHGVPDGGLVDFIIPDATYIADGVDYSEFGFDNSALLSEGVHALEIYRNGSLELLSRYQLPVLTEGGQNVVVLGSGYAEGGTSPSLSFFLFDESGSRSFMLDITVATQRSSLSAIKARY